MKFLAVLWNKLSGYKTTVASIYWGCVMPSLVLLYPDGVPSNINKWVVIVGLFLTSVGLGHKWYKKASEAAILLLSVIVLTGCSKKTSTIDILTPPKQETTKEVQRINEPGYGGLRYSSKPSSESIKETILFDFDSFILTDESKSILSRLCSDANCKTVSIVGACCPIGTDEYNYDLGMKRAESVRLYLTGLCQPSQIIVQSFGESNLVTDTKENYRLNRRAEIQIGE